MAAPQSTTSGPVEHDPSTDAVGGLLLLLSAVFTLILANTFAAPAYEALLAHEIGVEAAGTWWSVTVEHVVTEGLMTIFFFVVGLEIRRELYDGELATFRRAALPAAAALGGMLVPALVYLAVNDDVTARRAWGIPTATDIAFAIAALSLLGRRAVPALRVFLLSLAILDDIGGILVIAVVYSNDLAPKWLGVAAIGIVLALGMKANGYRRPWAYVVPAVVVWVGLHEAGVHATMAGVLMGLLTPPQPDRIGPDGQASSPSQRLQEFFQPCVAFVVMPAFAFAAAGVTLDLAHTDLRIAAGIALGLVVGKPVGIVAASWLATRLRIAELPTGVGFGAVAIVGILGGVGFTVALFIARLALPDPAMLASAKVGILFGSATAVVIALVAGRAVLRRPADRGQSASSTGERPA